MKPKFLGILQRESWFVVLSRSLLALVVGILCWPASITLLDLYDAYSPILEVNAPAWLLSICVFSIVVSSGLIIWSWLSKPNLTQIALDIEKNNPDLRDQLNCAVELEGKSKKRKLTFMEERVVSLTESYVREVSWKKGTRPSSSYWLLVITGLGLGVILSFWGSAKSPVRKAIDSFSEEPGLSVFSQLTGSPISSSKLPSNEFTRGSDVSIYADVLRGHRGAKSAMLHFKSKEGVESFAMLDTPVLGRFEFVIPSIQQPFEYRVTTPSLESEWYKLTPYDPPRVNSASWKVIPPAYLKSDTFTHNDFGYLRVPEGSLVELNVEVDEIPPNLEVKLCSKDANISTTKIDPITFFHSFTLSEEWKSHLEVFDLDKPGRLPVVYDPLILSPIPDDPPLVEIMEPAKDLQLPRDETFLVEVFASDDYGISDVRIRIEHAGEGEEETIFVEPIEKEKRLTYVFDLNERALAVGDVLTYLALASDNKEPESQIARSEVYFIEVLPPEGNSTEGPDSDMEGDSKEIPVRDFINKTKKIIRSTYDAMLESEEDKTERASIALASDALGLKHEMTKVYDENEGAFPIVDGIDLGELLNEATYHIEQTEIFVGDQLLEESLKPSGKTLRKLVQLYALMQKMPKQKSKGKGKPSEDEETASEENQPQEGESNSNPAEDLKELAEDLEELKEMENRQEELNRKIGRLAEAGVEGEKNQDTAQEQEELRRDLQAMRDDWYGKSGKLGDVAELDRAGNEMEGASGDLRRDQPRQAQPQGELAAEALGNAITAVEGKMAAIAAGMVDQLGKQAGGLAQGQRQLSESTEKANPGDGEQLKNSQEEINDLVDELLENIDRAGRSMGSFNENATEDLLRAARESRENGIERSGKRAANSLLYEAFPQAKKEEDKVAENLDQLEEALDEVENKLRNLGNSALRELAQRIQRDMENLPGMSDEEMKQEAEEIANALGSLPNASEDERLQNLTRFFEQMATSEEPSKGKSMAAAALAEAMELVEQFFWKEAKEELLRRNLDTSSAPSRYKRQVEEYFRRIAEGE